MKLARALLPGACAAAGLGFPTYANEPAGPQSTLQRLLSFGAAARDLQPNSDVLSGVRGSLAARTTIARPTAINGLNCNGTHNA